MEHFYSKINGWFDEPDCSFYKSIVRTFPRQEGHFVEVGSWLGRSTACMVVEIINSKKQIKFDCIDTWKGGDDIPKSKNMSNLFEVFTQNMLPVKGYYTPIIMDSVVAASLYPDNSLDFVFIDAAHDYDSVKNDILAWCPKIKSNGIIAGHDINHQPIKQAIIDTLGNKYIITGNCWVVKEIK